MRVLRNFYEAELDRDPAVVGVSQEHNPTVADDSSEGASPAPDTGSSPVHRDWSHLGRRVLAEAWRRLTDEHRPAQPCATPAVPAPHSLAFSAGAVSTAGTEPDDAVFHTEGRA